MALCGTDHGLVQNLLGGVDCTMGNLSELIYRLFTAPGSDVGVALTILLTLYVAVMGLRLMLGFSPLHMGDMTIAALKIGLVLALATNWPAYQQLVFNSLFHGPEQLAASLMQGVGHGGPFTALQDSFDELQASAGLFQRTGPALVSPMLGGTPFAAAALNMGSYLMLFSTLGLMLTAKIVLGLLLGLAPLLAGLLLFDATRGMFAGWLKSAVIFALLPFVATLALLVQMILIAPYIGALAQMRAGGQPDLALAETVFILLVISSMVSFAGAVAMVLVALGLKMPRWRPVKHTAAQMPVQGGAAPALALNAEILPPQLPMARALTLSLERQEQRARQRTGASRVFDGPTSTSSSAGDAAFTYRAPATPKRGTSNQRRDLR